MQTGILGCSSPAIWLEFTEYSESLCLRSFFYHRSCNGLPTYGGLTFVWYNDLRDITAEFLSKVCSEVAIEPPLQPVSGEIITPKTTSRQDDARADIYARGFWGQRQGAFLTQRFFTPMHQVTITPVYQLFTVAMSSKRKENMVSGSEKMN